MQAIFAASSVTIFALPIAAAAACLSPQDAGQHVGEHSCVCGVVLSAHYAWNARSQPTYLNLDSRYPDQIFTVVIFGADRSKFGAPERVLSGKRICAEGEIQLYRLKPEIIINDPSQLKTNSDVTSQDVPGQRQGDHLLRYIRSEDARRSSANPY